MKKTGLTIGFLVLIASFLPGEARFYTSLGLGIQTKSDLYFKKVYTEQSACLVLDAGYWFSDHIASGIRLGYSSMNGETVLLKSETSLRHMPVTAYIKAGGNLGGRWWGYVSMGIGYMLFREESYMGKVEDTQFGWEVDAGFEFSLAENFYLLCAARYQSFRESFPEMDETHQLGGMDFRMGIGIRY